MKNNHRYPTILGKYINLREADVEDSSFILELRTCPKKSKFINKTDPNLDKQIDYMKNYKTLDNEWYFIIEDKHENPVGTISVYPYPIFSDRWVDETASLHYQKPLGVMGPGRWLMVNNSHPIMGIESDVLVKEFFFNVLKHTMMPMVIHKDNVSVLNFHKKWGAVVVGWIDEISHHMLELTKEDYLKTKTFYERIVYGKLTL